MTAATGRDPEAELEFDAAEKPVPTVTPWYRRPGTLVGVIAFCKDWIDQLYVMPRAQRKGVGAALLDGRAAIASVGAQLALAA